MSSTRAHDISWATLKKRWNVLDVLSQYQWSERLTHRDSGGYSGPCPIHSGSRPDPSSTSFTVTESSQGWRCFGSCDAGGSIIDLVAQMEQVSMKAAGQLIASWIAEEEDDINRDTPRADIAPFTIEPALEPTLVSSGEGDGTSTQSDYEAHVYAGLPIYSTRLVRETVFDTVDFRQCLTPGDMFSFLGPYFLDRDREEFVVVLLDTAMQVTGMVSISVGGLNYSIIQPAQVFKPAILANAGSVILAHNHPSGNVEPSKADLGITRELVAAGQLLGIPVRDHLIVTDKRFCSLADRGLL